MFLTTGSSVGHYQILGSLGAGGMGEVYRARDTKLGRDVALKILPEAVSTDPERRARFAREARSLAALNHPNIAQVHGFEDGEPTSALIMELVDGQDLSERIRRGPSPFDDAIAIARQIGDALQTAHDRGIIHRDLKPGNIKVRDDGTVKVLDFGLAKALDQGSGIADQGSGELSNSPTITTPAMTMHGMILGTAAYMAPEQAKGRAVDRRADIWAFGCVLYEMLTGRKAFAGDDVSDTLASILKSDVDWTGVPPQATRLLKRCLEKDPRKRLHDVGDAWDLLEDRSPLPQSTPQRSSWLPWTVAALFAVTTIGLAALRFMQPAPAPPESARFQIAPPPNTEFSTYLAVSPDSRRVAFTASDRNRMSTLWVRDLQSLEARQLPGTENATSPFWSPDGRFIAFADGRVLKKIDLSGGPAQTLGEAPGSVGLGAWNTAGAIVVGTRGLGGLYKVPDTGGTLVPLTSIVEESERGHSFPTFLPDQKRFLYIKLSARADEQGVYMGSIDAAPEQQGTTRLLPLGFGPLVLTNGDQGRRLLFARGGTVMSQPFDADRVELSGEPTPVAERVGSAGSFAFFGAGSNVLVYRTGTAATSTSEQLTWFDRTGKEIAKVGDPLAVSAGPFSLAIAPDGRRAAVMISEAAPPADLWLVEFARGLVTRLTSTPGAEAGPVWAPDSRRLAFRRGRTDNFSSDMFVKDVDGADEEEPIAPQPTGGTPTDWSRDGRTILLVRGPDNIASDIFAWSTDRKVAEPLLRTAFTEHTGRLSSDGRWLAYVSNESGESEIYVRPFSIGADGKPAVGPKWRVSTSGGVMPRWRADGKELFFRAGNGDFMSVDVTIAGGSIQTTLPRRLFANIPSVHAWDVTADGQRFLISVVLSSPLSPAAVDPITVVLNWKSH